MLEIVSQVIDRVYKNKDYDFFKEACSVRLELFEELQKYIKTHGFRLEEKSNVQSPFAMWTVHVNNCDKGNFKVTYSTILRISKIAPLFCIEHFFSAKNMDPNGIDAYLTNTSGAEYTKDQFCLAEEVVSVLGKKSFERMWYVDMQEVVHGLNMPHKITNLGFQVKVEHLLFNDIFGLLDL